MNGRKMFDATCSICGEKCQVPFKPIPGRPVFCREHHKKKNGQRINQKKRIDFGEDSRDAEIISPTELMIGVREGDISDFNNILGGEKKIEEYPDLIVNDKEIIQNSKPSRSWDDIEKLLTLIEKRAKINLKIAEEAVKEKRSKEEIDKEFRKSNLEIETLAKKLIQKYPDSEQVYEIAAFGYMTGINFDGALRICDDGLERFSCNLTLLRNKIRILFGTKKYPEVIKIYDQIQDCAKSQPLKISHELEVMRYKTVALKRLNRYPDAAKCFEDILKIPNISKKQKCLIYDGYGLLLDIMKKYEDAIKNYDKAIENNPTRPNSFFNKGISLAKLHRIEEALKCYDKAIEINPKHSASHARKGSVLGRMGKHEDALKCYDEALRLRPENTFALNNKGVDLRKLGKTDDALKCYDNAIKINPKYSLGWHNKGNLLEQMGKIDDALKCYDNAIRYNPKIITSRGRKGVILSRDKNDFLKAIECFDEIIKNENASNGSLCSAWYNKGLALSRMKLSKKAIEAYEKSYELDESFISPLVNKANELRRLELFDESTKCADIILRKDLGKIWTTDPHVSISICRVLFNKGDILHYVAHKKQHELEEKIGKTKFHDSSVKDYPEIESLLINELDIYEKIWKMPSVALEYKNNKEMVITRKALVQHRLERFEDSIENLQMVLKINPRDIIALMMKADNYKEMGKLEESVKINKEIVTICDEKLKKDDSDLQALKQKRMVLEELDDKDGAYECLKKENELLQKEKDKTPQK